MNARDELEAVIWRNWPKGAQADPAVINAAVDVILDAADAYAVAALEDTENTPRAAARRRAILAGAVGDLYTPKSKHRWRTR